jgi:hypothetical protein
MGRKVWRRLHVMQLNLHVMAFQMNKVKRSNVSFKIQNGHHQGLYQAIK